MIQTGKYLFFLLFFSLLIGISCKSSELPNSQLQAAKEKLVKAGEKPLTNALLWKISGKELTKPSYLYGTIHMINDEDYFLPDGTLSAMDEAEKLVFEINMEDMSDMSKMMGFVTKAFMKDNMTLSDLLTDEEYELVQQHFEKIGLPIMMFERMKPMFLTVFASSDFDPTDLQSGAIKSYEMEFMEIGKRANKAFGGLETIDYQLSVFDSIPYQAQANMLIESLKSTDSDNGQFQEMIQMYKDQDINAMVEMFNSEEGGLEGYEDILVNQRNKNWIPIMEDMMKTGVHFFAVGAGHLGGKEGVIRLLQNEGYVLIPVSHKGRI